MNIEDLPPAMQAQLEAVLQSIILWGTRIVAPQLLALDWLCALQLEVGLPARMRRVYAGVMADLAKHKTDCADADAMLAALKRDGVEFPTAVVHRDLKPDNYHSGPCEFANPPDPLDNPTMDGVVWMCPTKAEAAAWGNRPWQIRAGFDGTHIDHLPTEWLAGHDAIYRPVRNVLDWPEMDGETWTDAKDVSLEMLRAWPLFECRHADGGILNVPSHSILLAHRSMAHEWRPLRFPGQDPITGSVEGPDMTPEHFSGVWESRYFRSLGYGWSSWVPSNIKSWDLTMGARVQFRPVGWPEPIVPVACISRTIFE